MSETIDKLIFALDGDLSQLKARYSEAEAGAQKTGTTIKANFAGGFKDAADAATQHTAAIKKAMGEVDTAVKSTHGSTATATREFRALFDELSSGRTRQTPGTLAIIATRVFGISGATLAWSAALAAIPVGMAVAAAMAERSLARIDEALKRTGGQAGVTADQIRRIAESGIPGLSTSGAQGVLGVLAARGNIAPDLLGSVARAVPGFARASGTTNDKAAAELEKLLSDPAKAAQELNAEFKLLDVSTTRQIEALEASGNTAEAQALLAKALNDRFDALAKSSWSLAGIFNSLGTGLSNFFNKTGQVLAGSSETDVQKLRRLQGELSGATAAQSRIRAGTFEGGGAGAVDVLKALATLPAEIAALQKKITEDTGKTILARARSDQNSAVGFGLKIADEYDTQDQKAKKLTEQLSGLNKALDNAIGPNAKYRAEILKERDAVDLALKNQRTPAQIAAEEADDQRRIAAAPESQRNTLRAQLAAQRERERNLSDPRTAPFAQSIYDSQMGVAALNNRDLNKDASETKRMADNLAGLKAQATAAQKVADAYAISDAAGEKAKATGEVDVEVSKKQIAAEDRLAAVQAKVATAYANANTEIGKQINALKLSNAGLMAEEAAGGNPALLAAAKRSAEVENAVKNLSPADAARRRPELMAQYTQRDTANGVIGVQSSLFGQRTALSNLQASAGVFGPDALRQLEVMQSTMEHLVRSGLDPASDDFKKLYNQLLPVNMQISDLSEKVGRLRQAASDFASDITGPLEQFLEKGGSIRRMIGDVFGGLGRTTIHDFIIEPLQRGLEGAIGGLLGVSLTKPDGSITRPFYVMSSPLAGLMGGGGAGGGILGGLIGSFGSGGKAGTGLAGMAESFVGSLFGGGKASGGYIDPGKFYVVGEHGPEVLGPGAGGKITPLSAPNQAVGGGTTTLHSNVAATIVVQGTGDKELMANMEMGARQIVKAGIEQNNKMLARTQRPQLIAANKRALP